MSQRAATIGGVGGLGLIVFLLISFLGGESGDFGQVLDQFAPQQQTESGIQPEEFQGSDDYEVFVSTVLGSTDDLWHEIFTANDLTYAEPTLVLFRDATSSACGGAHSLVGPHYCPPDETIYLDETFFDELQNRFGAQGGDVAEAYVIAHEVGHHVQNRLGIMNDVRMEQAGLSTEDANRLSISLELQADCFAGVWANSIRDAGVFLPGEIEMAPLAARPPLAERFL
jgi:predicted metalloprotease